MDNDRLIKFLNLSASVNDGEALSATRYANNFLKENNLTWERILREKYTMKKLEIEYAILHMSMLKERSHSRDLEDGVEILKTTVKFLAAFSIILIFAIIYIMTKFL